MIKSLKIRLVPTAEQEKIMWQSVGVSRWAYNYSVFKKKKSYETNLKNISEGDIRKEITQLKKEEEYSWLTTVSAEVIKQSVKDCETAFKLFFKNKTEFPKFKSKKKSKQSFYVRYDRLYFKTGFANLEKIGKVKVKTNYEIPNVKYTNPRCSFDGKYWYLTFGIEFNENQVELNQNLSIGIDLGIKELAVCSNGMKFKNINKSHKVKTLHKRLKRFQRQLSRKYEINKQENKFVETNNIKKLKIKIKLLYRKISNIRKNHLNHATRKIVDENPLRIVLEDLNITGMIKNKHLAKSIAEQNFYEFRRQIEYKAKFRGITVVFADRWYPSSKTCSRCGILKKDLKLKDRIFKCECGLRLDRDLNASINLAKYS